MYESHFNMPNQWFVLLYWSLVSAAVVHTATSCYTPQSSVRLVDGDHSSSYRSGRVEVCVDGFWGTVCDDSWDSTDASVVCRQLGYSRLSPFAYTFGRGSNLPILLDDVACTGSESTLVDCPYDTSPSCGHRHSQDAGVRCQIQLLCQDGDVRLEGGSTSNQGRVEVCKDETWGTVCDDYWDTTDASVVCRQLGYSTNYVVAYSSAKFGPGSGPIYLDDVACRGYESRLTSCSHDTSTSDCSHYEDAGVFCQPSACQNGDVRLMDGSTELEGRVEICTGGVWATVCGDNWAQVDATVVCRQLGHSALSAEAYTGSHSGDVLSSVSSWTNVDCTGYECGLVDCQYDQTSQCSNSDDAGVRCQPLTCQYGAIRLVGDDSSALEGRVEICLNGVWGTVCDSYWTQVDAIVVCRQLGYSDSDAIAYSYTRFGQGSGALQMRNVGCSGSESRLIDCSYNSASTYCDYYVAGVSCEIGVPGVVQNVSVQSTDPYSLTTTWTPLIRETCDIILEYNILCADANGNHSTSAQTFEVTIDDLHPYTYYTCCVSVVSVAGRGESDCGGGRTNETVPAVAPQIVSAVRTTATSIEVILEPLTTVEETRGIITSYSLDYKGVDSLSTCMENGASNYVYAQSPKLLITDLDPTLKYCLAAAASTSAGVGNYSELVTVEPYSSSFFQVLLTGPTHCDVWMINRTLDKVNALREALVNGIKTNCNCSITADYIGNGQLVCFEAITFRGQIFSTDTHDDTVLLSLLQEWVSTSPMVIVEGETLQVLGNCRVELEHLDSNETYCTVSATFPIYTLISSIAAGIVAILMVLGLIVGCYVCYRKGGMCHRKAGIVHNKSKKRKEHVYDTRKDIELQNSKAEQEVAVVKKKERTDPHKITTSAAQPHPNAVPVIKGMASHRYPKAVPVVKGKEGTKQPHAEITTPAGKHYPKGHKLPVVREKDANPARSATQTEQPHTSHIETARDERIYQPLLPSRLCNTAPTQQEVYDSPTPDVSSENLPKRLYNTAPKQQEVCESPIPDVSGQSSRGNSNGQNKRIYQPLLPNKGRTQQQGSIYHPLAHKLTMETPHAKKHGRKR